MRHHATTEQPCGLGGLARPLLLSLALAGLAGCGDQSPMGPETATGANAVELAPDLTAAGSDDATVAAAEPRLAAATRLPRSFFVNPVTGKDTNTGTNAQPFKTLARGLSTAIAGDTLRLAAGVYSAATNGEQFTGGIRVVSVPAGVVILGTLAGDLTSQLHGAAGDAFGLSLQGGATVRNLVVTGFPTGIQASQGAQSFRNLTLSQNTLGLNLTGTAKATLVDGKVSVPVTSPGGDPIGARLADQAQLIVTGGTITGPATCAPATKGASLGGATRLTLRSGAVIKNITGSALTMGGTSRVNLTGATIDRDLLQFPGCGAGASIFAVDSATVTLKHAVVRSSGGSGAIGILTQSRGLFTLDSSEVTGHTGAGIKTQDSPRILVTGSVIQQNTVGVEGGLSRSLALTVTGSTVSGNGTGIHAPFFKLRKSTITGNQTGIAVATFSADLGQAGDPGNNVITGNSTTGVTWDSNVIGTGAGGIFASGNTWNPSTQLADATGKYPQSPLLNNDSPSATGKNFVLPTIDANDLFQIQL